MAGDQGVTVFIADDGASLAQILAAALAHHGFQTVTFADGRSLLAAVLDDQAHVDVIVLDVMMPGLDGIETCGKLRAAGHAVPVIFLSARDASLDKVAGLRAGGDDYVTKPFDLDELVARVEVCLRRADRAPVADVLSYADLVVDEKARRVRRGDAVVELTSTEYRLLVYLLRNAGNVVSKSQILDAVWNYDFDGDASVVETYIYYLRRKVDAEGPKLIHTIRGAGYSLRTAP